MRITDDEFLNVVSIGSQQHAKSNWISEFSVRRILPAAEVIYVHVCIQTCRVGNAS